MASLGEWRYTCDRSATAEVYARASFGYSSQCTCNGCRNFVGARAEVFPPAFLSLLTTLGIDPAKDGEVYHNGRLSPGKHHYGGWFHSSGRWTNPETFRPWNLARALRHTYATSRHRAFRNSRACRWCSSNLSLRPCRGDSMNPRRTEAASCESDFVASRTNSRELGQANVSLVF